MTKTEKSQDLESRLSEMLNMITEAYINRQLTPSVRDLQSQIGCSSTSTIHRYLRILQDRGLIILAPGKNRGIMLPAEDEDDNTDEGGVPNETDKDQE